MSSFIVKTKNGYEIFNDYISGKFIYDCQLQPLNRYISANIISDYVPNRSYYQDWQNESNNLQIVIRWREKNSLLPVGKYGERICSNIQAAEAVIDLTKKEHLHHNEICNSCNKIQAVPLF